jgi:hypothetical protein
MPNDIFYKTTLVNKFKLGIWNNVCMIYLRNSFFYKNHFAKIEIINIVIRA